MNGIVGRPQEWKRVGSVKSPHLVKYFGVEFRQVRLFKAGLLENVEAFEHLTTHRALFVTAQVLSVHGLLHERFLVKSGSRGYAPFGNCPQVHSPNQPRS